MIDAVSTLSVQASASRATSGNAVSIASSPSLVSEIKFVGSRIRMDNNLDMAIMEFRSVETGDILRQYPSEPQIRAFQRAASTEARAADSAPQYDVVVEAPEATTTSAAPQTTTSGAESSAPVVTTTSPSPAPVSTPTPSVSSAPAASSAPATSSDTSGDTGGSTSVVV
jgi:hypothetical protein